MGKSYFIWNGKDCRNMGVTLEGPVAIIRPEERVKHVEIPGRSGDLTQVEGENIYNSYIQTATIQVRGGYRVREVYKWLRGAGYVTFSGEPDRKQPARIIGAVTLNKHSHNLDIWVGEVQFYCQPLKELLTEEKVTVISYGASVWNNGDVTCRPMWKVLPDSNQYTVTLTAGGKTITVGELPAVYPQQPIYIDSETMEVWNSTKTSLYTSISSGDFPVLDPGENTVTGIGWANVEIEKRERYL